ncbi:hypothetical protein CE91St56_23040 [Lachnospiraceae bacterium]|nr:hypothetical protein CE91St56_23040 [Lachnospiraceae bacterium]GKH41248.1 hypothetical protein CE91St57_22220 [Lachnospiraceae bacterium]
MKKITKERIKKMAISVVPSIPLLFMPMIINAGGLQDTKLVQGFNNLLKDGTTAMCFLEAAVLILLEVVEGIAWQKGEHEEAPKHKKKMLSMLGLGALIISVTALVPVFFSYFL